MAETYPHYVTKLEQITQLNQAARDRLKPVTDKFVFRANDYYLSLIDWDDPADPIRRLVIPNEQELEGWGRLDPSDEGSYTILPGLEHKYGSTALLLISPVCDGICRYCFRKRVFIDAQATCLCDLPAAVEYIQSHPEITNILLTGGDPLTLTTERIAEIIGRLRAIEHVQIIRIGTRIPVFNPYRIIEDPGFLNMIEKYSTDQKKIYIMTHFVHPREVTDLAVRAAGLLQKAGAVMANQTPLVRGINDDPSVLGELLGKLSFIGVVPYYIFQCRPALGNRGYMIPVEQGYDIVERAKSLVSGLAKRARYVMSHSTGKVEIIGRTGEWTCFKYHRAADDVDSGRFMAFRSNPQAYWLDDYAEMASDYPMDMPYRAYGPD